MKSNVNQHLGTAPDPVAHALRRLTRAVWVLAALLALVLAVMGAAVWVVARGISNAQTVSMSADPETTEGAHSSVPVLGESSRYNGFHDWPNQRKVAEASVIIVTASEGVGKDARDVITEVIKQAPNVEFYYKVGDVYDNGFSRRDRGAVDVDSFGLNGKIVFFVGSPADMKYAVSYATDTGRCSSLGGISLEQLRELARQTPDVQRKG